MHVWNSFFRIEEMNEREDYNTSRVKVGEASPLGPLGAKGTSAIDFGQFRLRPVFFSSSANSTSANFDFGQFRLRPIFGC